MDFESLESWQISAIKSTREYLGRIQAVKVLRLLTACGLADAARLVRRIEEDESIPILPEATTRAYHAAFSKLMSAQWNVQAEYSRAINAILRQETQEEMDNE